MRPLEDITVIDCTQALIGPLATQILGDFGADVIKVERPGHGDLTRNFATRYEDFSAYFTSLNRNKRSLTLDMTTDSGQRVLKELAAEADVFIHNFSPGKAEAFDAEYETLREVNDQLLYCGLSGYGEESPYSDRKLFDIIAQGQSGLMSVTGTEDGEPVRIGVSIADISGAMTATYSILTALYHRERTGEGQSIDIALFDTAFSYLLYHVTNYFATGENPDMLGTKHPNLTPYQAVKTADEYIVIGVVSESLWPPFCRAVDREEWMEDPRFATFDDRIQNRDEFDAQLEELFSERPAAEWLDRLQEAGVPCTPVNDVEDVVNDPHVEARNMVEEVEHPDGDELKLPGIPVNFSEVDADIRLAPPKLGEHTDEILTDLLGYSDGELESLRDDDVV
jgi:crotonobetainyl-CoA:carnitine CoA-transferase CaiB-like acyl-CoA transferase